MTAAMGKRQKKQHRQDGPGARVRLEHLLAAGDTRAAVEAAKVLVREEPGPASEALAVRAYAERIKALIKEGLGREAMAIAGIVRERFPAHLSEWTTLLEDARLAAGDFDWILGELPGASEERAAIEDRLTAWIVDPSAIARVSALDPADPLAREARIVAELFEIVTSRLASAEEMAPLGEIRRRSPLAPWKLLVRALDAFYRNEDSRAAANVAAIDSRSPAARAGEVLSELIAGRQKSGLSVVAERLVDRISGGRATIAAQFRSIQAASQADDRKRMREEMRALSRSSDPLSPFAREQVRLALLDLCGMHFGPDQVAALFRIEEQDPNMQRYGALLMEFTGMPFASDLWLAYADGLAGKGLLEPWQAAEIYLHMLSLGAGADDVCNDPSHDHSVFDHDFDDDFDDEDEMPPAASTAEILEKIIAARPAPAVLGRIAPHLDRLDGRERRRVLSAWRKADPEASEPVVRLLRLAEDERRYDEGLKLLGQSRGMKIVDPEYARLRLRLSLRKAEQLLAARKHDAAAVLLAEIAARPEDLGEDGATYLLALRWAAAPPAAAGELLAELAQRGVTAEVVLAEVTAQLGMRFALPAAHPSPTELLEGVRRGITLLDAVGRPPEHLGWILERTAMHLDQADEGQALAIGSAARAHRLMELAWNATARGLAIKGPWLHRTLMLRAELLIDLYGDFGRISSVLAATRALAQRVQDSVVVARATELLDAFRFFSERPFSEEDIASIVDQERAAKMRPTRGKAPAKRKSSAKQKKGRGAFQP